MKKKVYSIIETMRKKRWFTAICTIAVLSMFAVSGIAFAAATNTEQYIGEAQAKSIALSHAGVSEQESFVKVHLDRENRRVVYDVEFYSGNTEYDYEIDAISGDILEYDHEIENYVIPTQPKPSNQPAQPTPSTTPSDNTGQYIGEAKAKSIALNHAGVSEQQATFIKAYLDRDDGRIVYDVEFYSGNTEYDYEIDAISGDILEYDHEIENYVIPTQPKPSNQPAQPTPSTTPSDNTGQYIGEAKAKSIALNHAGVSEQQATFIKAHLDRDDGRVVYDIEFYSENTEYDYEIDAVSGDIREYDHEVESHTIPQKTPVKDNESPTSPSDKAEQYIGVAKAKSIALNHSGLSESQVHKLKVKLDCEDGKAVYEVDFKDGQTEYEYEIDAESGAIRKSDIEHDD